MTSSQKILLVDDDREIVRGASLRLQAAGYGTVSAGDGLDGVVVAVDQRPDAIVLDVRMPRMDGLSALRELKRRDATKDIPVVMLSASLVDQKQALEGGARFFVRKPYQGQELVAAIQEAMAEAIKSHAGLPQAGGQDNASSDERPEPLESRP